MIKILIFIISILLLNNIVYAVQPTPIPEAENIIFVDLLHAGNDKKLIVFQDGIYYGTFNYSDTILFNPDVNYTVIIDEDYIDLIQDETFFTKIFSRYSTFFINIGIMLIIIGIFIYIFNKSRK